MTNHKLIMMSRLIYKSLITKFLKNVLNIKRQNKSLLKQLANLNLVRKSLVEQLHELNSPCDSLNIENSDLVDQIDKLVASQYEVQYEFCVQLDNLLSFQTPYGNTHGLSFDNDALYSKDTPSTQGKILFVPTIVVEDPSSRMLDKGGMVFYSLKNLKSVGQGKRDRIPLKSKVEGVNPPRRQPTQSSIPKCYHCGKMGHI